MLNGQTNNRGANIQSRISPNSERSVSEVDGDPLVTLGPFKAIAKATHRGDLYPTGLDFLAEAMDVYLDRIMTDLFSPAAKVIHQLILADKSPHAIEQYFKKADFPCRQIQCFSVYLGNTTNLIVSKRPALDGR